MPLTQMKARCQPPLHRVAAVLHLAAGQTGPSRTHLSGTLVVSLQQHQTRCCFWKCPQKHTCRQTTSSMLALLSQLSLFKQGMSCEAEGSSLTTT